MNYGLICLVNNDVQLQGYIDDDWGGSDDDRNNTLGVCFSLGSALISYMSRKHRYFILNIAKEKYIATNEACIEAVWLQKLFVGLFDQELEWTMIYFDN